MSEDVDRNEPGPLFWMGAQALTHVGEYRRYYALLALWVVVMLVVPRVGVSELEGPAGAGVAGPASVSSARSAPESAAAAALARPSSPAAATFFSDPVLDAVTGPSTFGGAGNDLTPVAPPSSIAFAPPSSSVGEDEPVPEAPADPGSPLEIPPPPPVPVPPPPAELEPLLRVVTPLANTACSPIGLAGVVVALVGPSVEQVPAGQIIPYLTPLYVACGTFPQTGPRTVCELDELYVSQDPTGGLLPPPAVIGLGIDTIAQMEAALGGFTGQADVLRQQLNCRRG